MTDDKMLVKLLRERVPSGDVRLIDENYPEYLYMKAADRIEALEAEIGLALGVPSTSWDGPAAESMRVILRRALRRTA
jgi:hypothetical protein